MTGSSVVSGHVISRMASKQSKETILPKIVKISAFISRVYNYKTHISYFICY